MQPNLKGENFDILGNMIWSNYEHKQKKILGSISVCQYTNKHWYHKYFKISLTFWAIFNVFTPNIISKMIIIALFLTCENCMDILKWYQAEYSLIQVIWVEIVKYCSKCVRNLKYLSMFVRVNGAHAPK